jgi:phosphate transport system substrate-binding protein
MRRLSMLALIMIAALVLAGCPAATPAQPATGQPAGEAPATGGEGAATLSGDILVDGSSTVYPITEAMAEEFGKVHRSVRLTVGISGTGGGFKKFCNEETDISNASRPIKPSEVELCEESEVDYIELPIAYDGLAVVVHPDNDWAQCITVDELNMMWGPEAEDTITRWNQIRPEWPDQPMTLYAPGVDSGTFDYFTEAINGGSAVSRSDFFPSEDDNVLVQGVADDLYALGYFGLAYFEENAERLQLVAIDDENPDNGAGCILPTPETVQDGTYQPLARPVFIYVNADAPERSEIQSFVEFYLNPVNANELVREVGYIALPERVYELALERFNARTTGSIFEGEGAQVGVTLEDLLATE